MRREVPMEDLQRRYFANDMAKIGCGGCRGCFDCCCGMGESAVLDPLDICRLCEGLHTTFAALLEERLELHVVDGMILPNLKMQGNKERCGFLSAQGRCDIHAFRPGICRLFPLGRIYEDGAFTYFVQSHECRMEPKSKVKISKWLDVPDIRRYERYILAWHDLLEEARQFLKEQKDERLSRDLNVYMLEHFFKTPYHPEQFYEEFDGRAAQVRKLMAVMKRPEA